MKSMNREFCKNVLRVDMDLYVENFKTVLYSKKPIIIRIPVIGDYTNNVEHIDNIISFLDDMKGNIIEIELLKGHELGKISISLWDINHQYIRMLMMNSWKFSKIKLSKQVMQYKSVKSDYEMRQNI